MRALFAFVASLIVMAIAAAQSSPAGLAATVAVSVVDDAYVDSVSNNSTTTVVVGDTVVWTWAGSNQHTVSSTSAEAFDSGSPTTSGTFNHTFNALGTFTYVCGVHGTAMTGTVIVQAGAPTNTPLPATATPAAATSTPAGASSATVPAATPTGPASAPTSATLAPAGQATAVASPTTGPGAQAEATLPAAGAEFPGESGGLPFWFLLSIAVSVVFGATAILTGVRRAANRRP